MNFFTLIIILIFFYYICNRLYQFLPKSEIHNKHNRSLNSVFIDTDIKNYPLRIFDILDEKTYKLINEIFEHEHIRWKENKCIDRFDLFEKFKCRYYKKIPLDYIPSKTLIYFPHNNIKWHHDCYLYDIKKDMYYYPKPNSLIYSDNVLEWKGNKNINIVMSK